MLKQHLFKVIALMAVAFCLIIFTSCESNQENPEQTTPETNSEITSGQAVNEQTTADFSEITSGQPVNEQTTADFSEITSGQAVNEQTTADFSEITTVPDHEETTNQSESDYIKKISGASDENGIYAVVLTLSDKIADKGTVEMVYCGAKGTPQESSVVNTFRVEYYKQESGTYEVHTFFDGEVYQNLHNQAEVKVNNTFGATLRAGNVKITYTPDGGEAQEIYFADAEQFYKP